MNIKRIVAFLVTLSMLVGLFAAMPVMALDYSDDYAEEIIIEEEFEGSLDSGLTKLNGTIADGKINFVFEGNSGISIKEPLKLDSVKQQVIEFALATEVTYEEETLKATYIGLYTSELGATPKEYKDGVWVGITKDVIILQFTDEAHRAGFEGSVLSVPVPASIGDLEDREYRVIYQGKNADLQVKVDGEYVSLVEMNYNEGTKKYSLTCNSMTLTAPQELELLVEYFVIGNISNKSDVSNNPLESEGEGEEPEAPIIENASIDYINYKVATDLLATDETLGKIADLVAEFEAILGDGSSYIEETIVEEEILDLIAIGEAIDETTLEKDALSFAKTAQVKLNTLVTVEYKDEFIAYLEGIEGEDELVAEALAVIAEGVDTNDIDNALMTLGSALVAKKAEREEGYITFKDDLYRDTTISNLSDNWTVMCKDNEEDAFAIDGGLYITAESEDSYLNELRLKKNLNSSYSVKATLNKVEDARVSMNLRQTGEDCTHTETLTIIGHRGIMIQSDGEDFSEIKVAVAKGVAESEKEGSVLEVLFNVNEIASAAGKTLLSDGGKEITILAKDYGKVVELYLVATDGTEVKFASINMNIGASNVAKGYILNELTKEVTEFLGMKIAPKGSIAFVVAEGDKFLLKDVEVAEGVIAEGQFEYADGAVVTETVFDAPATMNVGDSASFAIGLVVNKAKTLGSFANYAETTIDITNDVYTTITVSGNDAILVIEDGTVEAVGRGTAIVEAEYVFDGESYVAKTIIEVEDPGYSESTTPYEMRVEEAYVANVDVLKSMAKETSVTPLVMGKLGNGSEVALNEYKVEFEIKDRSGNASSDLTYAGGKFTSGANEALVKVTGKAYFMVNGSETYVEIEPFYVEIVDAEDVTLGESYTGVALDIVELPTEATIEEKKAALDAADMGLIYESDEDVERIYAEVADLYAPDKEAVEVVEKAYNNAMAVADLVEVVSEDDIEELREYLITDKHYQDFGISTSAYNNLTSKKKTEAITRVLNQLKAEGETVLASKVKSIFNSIVSDLSGGGGGGSVKDEVVDETGDDLKDTPPLNDGPAFPMGPAPEAAPEKDYTANANFKDIEDAAWAKNAIGKLVEAGIVNGYSDGTIRPNASITRDEFVKMLVVALSIETNGAENSFADIDNNAWQAPYVAAAVKAELVTGIANGVFGSGKNITRQDMAVIIYRAVEKYNIALGNNGVVAFKDGDNIASYAKEAVVKLAEAGVVSGMGDGLFVPAATATRAQAMSMVAGLLGLIK